MLELAASQQSRPQHRTLFRCTSSRFTRSHICNRWATD